MQYNILGPVDNGLYYYNITSIPGILVIVDKEDYYLQYTHIKCYKMLYCIKCNENSPYDIPYYYISDTNFIERKLTKDWGWYNNNTFRTFSGHHTILPYGYRCWYTHNNLKTLEKNIDILSQIYNFNINKKEK